MIVSLIEPDQECLNNMFSWFNSNEGWRIKKNKRKWSFVEFAEYIRFWTLNFIKIKENKAVNIVGYIAFADVDYSNNRSDIHLFIQKDFRGSKIGIEAVKVAFDQYFKDNSMNKLKARIPEYNKNIIEFAKKVGMKEEGILKKEMFAQGRYWDIHIFGLLKNDYIDMIETKKQEKPLEIVEEPEMAIKED